MQISCIITITYITKERNLQRYNKIKRSKLPIRYYASISATFNLTLLGVIEINPGPGFSAPKCTVCGKVVEINNECLICFMCFDVVHAKCSKQLSDQQEEYDVITLVTVFYTRSCHFSMFQTCTQTMACVTLLMIIVYQLKIRIRILLTVIKLFLLLTLTRKLSVKHSTNSDVC